MERVDVVVIGLGAVGSAAVYHLARQGKDVRGFDRFSPPHALGSSHGETRITRLAIGEGEEYSPLAMRSHALWNEMERLTGKRLLVTCGGLIISNRDEPKESRDVRGFLDNTLRAARKYSIDHECLSSSRIRDRFPQFRVEDHEEGYYEPTAGFLYVERCIEAQLTLAKSYGADLCTGTAIEAYRPVSDGVEIHTTTGETCRADQLLVCAGAWLPRLIDLDTPYRNLFTVTRQVMHWFEVRSHLERFSDPSFPVFIWEPPGKARPIYGFPPQNNDPALGVKIATEATTVVDPDHVDRNEPHARIREAFREHFSPCLPDLGPRSLNTKVCLYTEVEGGRFVIDRVPGQDRVLFASACSGHGFKHSAALGEALAQILISSRSTIDLAPFTLASLVARRGLQ